MASRPGACHSAVGLAVAASAEGRYPAGQLVEGWRTSSVNSRKESPRH